MAKQQGKQQLKRCLPKKKCCVSKKKCKRCPLMALRNGTLPDGYTVKKRKLVKVKTGKKQPLAA